jgi:AraC-like DNA-binding protein
LLSTINSIRLFKTYIFSLFFLFFTAAFQSQLKEDAGYFADKAYSKLYNNPEESLDFTQNLILNEKNPDKIIYQNIIAQSYAMKGDYINSIKTILGTEDLKTENTSAFHQFFFNYCLADQYQNLGLYEQSQKVIFQILEKTKFPANPQTEITLGKIYQLQSINYAIVKSYKKAQDYLDKSDKHFKIKSEEGEILKTENQLFRGIILLNQKKINPAKAIFNEVLQDNILNKYAFLYALARENSARAAFLEQDYERADTLLLQAAAKIEKTNYLSLKSRIYESLSNSYLAQNNNVEYQRFRSLFEDQKTKMDENKKSAISYLVTVIEDLNQEEYGFYETDITRSRNWVVGFCLALVVVCGIFYVLADRKKREIKKQLDFFKNYAKPFSSENPSTPVSQITVTEVRPEVKSMLSPEKVTELLDKLKAFENSKLFLSKQISLTFLASELETNIKYLSEVIKQHKGKKFNNYINDLRIQYVINLLKTDPSYLNYKVSYLAEISGFSSHSAFTAIFKSITGMSPNDFIQQINLQNKS